jgi:hypothetical protein
VTPDNFSRYAMGHLQNPREAPEPMEDGERAIIADLVISGEPLVGKVRSKTVRDNSLGYDFGIERRGQKICQVSMMANHNAVVPSGRAGDLISIGDALAAPPEPEASPPGSGNGHAAATDNAVQPKKEKPKVKNRVLDLLGRGFKALAADSETDPEELAQAAVDVGKYHDAASEPDMDPEQQTLDAKRKARDKRARDNDDPEDEVTEETMTQDAARKKAHDDLDAMLDGKKGKDKRKATDADIAALKDLIDDFLGEEEQEPEHQDVVEDADPAELEEVLGAGEEPDAEDAEELPCPDCGAADCEGCGPKAAAMKDSMEAEPGEELEPSGELALAHDAAPRRRVSRVERTQAQDAVMATLRMLKPFVARAKDNSLKLAFNTALAAATKPSRASSGDYGAFAGAARDRNRSMPRSPMFARANDGADKNARLQKAYDDIRTGRVAAQGGK